MFRTTFWDIYRNLIDCHINQLGSWAQFQSVCAHSGTQALPHQRAIVRNQKLSCKFNSIPTAPSVGSTNSLEWLTELGNTHCSLGSWFIRKDVKACGSSARRRETRARSRTKEPASPWALGPGAVEHESALIPHCGNPSAPTPSFWVLRRLLHAGMIDEHTGHW